MSLEECPCGDTMSPTRMSLKRMCKSQDIKSSTRTSYPCWIHPRGPRRARPRQGCPRWGGPFRGHATWCPHSNIQGHHACSCIMHHVLDGDVLDSAGTSCPHSLRDVLSDGSAERGSGMDAPIMVKATRFCVFLLLPLTTKQLSTAELKIDKKWLWLWMMGNDWAWSWMMMIMMIRENKKVSVTENADLLLPIFIDHQCRSNINFKMAGFNFLVLRLNPSKLHFFVWSEKKVWMWISSLQCCAGWGIAHPHSSRQNFHGGYSGLAWLMLD